MHCVCCDGAQSWHAAWPTASQRPTRQPSTEQAKLKQLFDSTQVQKTPCTLGVSRHAFQILHVFFIMIKHAAVCATHAYFNCSVAVILSQNNEPHPCLQIQNFDFSICNSNFFKVTVLGACPKSASRMSVLLLKKPAKPRQREL